MKAQVISFYCVLKNTLGQTLGSSFNQEVLNQMDPNAPARPEGNLKGLVAGIQNVKTGEKRRFPVLAAEAFGLYDPALLLQLHRSEVQTKGPISLGSELVIHSAHRRPPLAYRVTQFKGETLVLDGNHPLAGQDIVFEIEIVAARDACAEDFEDQPLTYVH